MGLFDMFKKKKVEVKAKNAPVSVKFTVTTPTNNKYQPWDKNGITTNDNYAIAAFVRISKSGAKIGSTNDDYARYFNYRFGISDPISYHKKVIADGYLVEASPETSLKKLKVDQLKSILTNAGLPIKGKKDELISRIIGNVNVSSLGLEKYYIPSERGLEHLRKYEYVFASGNYDVSCSEYEAKKEEHKNSGNQNDIIWRSLNDSFNSYNTTGDYGLARNKLFNMAQLLKNEGKYVDALYYYCLTLYYDTSGCANGRKIEPVDNISIAPALADAIRKLKSYYDPQIVNRCYDRYTLPHHYISKQNFEKLIHAIFNGEVVDMSEFVK